jgi:hypothetical protein
MWGAYTMRKGMWFPIGEHQHISMVTAKGLEGGQDGEARTPLGPEVTATEGGELRTRGMHVSTEDSKSGDEEWGGLLNGKTKKGKKDKKEARTKTQRVMSDAEDSEKEAKPAAGRKQENSAVEEGDLSA